MMQIVIDIDKEDYEDINDIHFIREDLKFKIGKAIMNGIPLPKYHGALLDDEILFVNLFRRNAFSDITLEELSQIKKEATIIEADRKEAEW